MEERKQEGKKETGGNKQLTFEMIASIAQFTSYHQATATCHIIISLSNLNFHDVSMTPLATLTPIVHTISLL